MSDTNALIITATDVGTGGRSEGLVGLQAMMCFTCQDCKIPGFQAMCLWCISDTTGIGKTW